MTRRSATTSPGSASTPTQSSASRSGSTSTSASSSSCATAGRVYACYETPEELDLRRKVLLGRGLPPVYERKPEGAPVPEGVAPHWRFRLDHDAPIDWTDLVRGEQNFDPQLLISDPVIRRADGSWLYLLPSVIDDIDLAITHVVRGEDHVSNSAVQLQMFAALGASRPHFAHEALLVAAEGKLSKRLGSSGSTQLREAGIEPMALLSAARPPRHFAAGRGQGQPRRAGRGFDFRPFRPRPGAFRPRTRSSSSTRNCSTISTSPTSPTGCPPGRARPTGCCCAAISTIWPSLPTGCQCSTATSRAPRRPPTTAPSSREAAELAADLDWSADPWPALADALKAATGRKGKALFQPLRLALTGREFGPEMAPLLKRIGRDRALARLSRRQLTQLMLRRSDNSLATSM